MQMFRWSQKKKEKEKKHTNLIASYRDIVNVFTASFEDVRKWMNDISSASNMAENAWDKFLLPAPIKNWVQTSCNSQRTTENRAR